MGEVMEDTCNKNKHVFLTAKGCRNLEEEDVERAGGAAGAGVFLDEKRMNQCTNFGHGCTYTWLFSSSPNI